MLEAVAAALLLPLTRASVMEDSAKTLMVPCSSRHLLSIQEWERLADLARAPQFGPDVEQGGQTFRSPFQSTAVTE